MCVLPCILPVVLVVCSPVTIVGHRYLLYYRGIELNIMLDGVKVRCSDHTGYTTYVDYAIKFGIQLYANLHL